MVIRSARGNQSGAAAGVRQGIIRASANAARSDFMPLIVRGLTRLRKGTLGDRPDCPKARLLRRMDSPVCPRVSPRVCPRVCLAGVYKILRSAATNLDGRAVYEQRLVCPSRPLERIA